MINHTKEESFIDWLDGKEPEAQEQAAYFYAWNRQQVKIDRLVRQLAEAQGSFEASLSRASDTIKQLEDQLAGCREFSEERRNARKRYHQQLAGCEPNMRCNYPGNARDIFGPEASEVQHA